MRRPPARRDRAILVRMTPFGEADAVVTLLTQGEGMVPALARRARGAGNRRPILEPFHSLDVEIAPGSGELSKLVSSVLATPRPAIVEDIARFEAAGLAVRWTRALAPPRSPEPEVYDALEDLLDALDAGAAPPFPLARFGLRLLGALGYGLEIARCARCSRPRPRGQRAYVIAEAGGVVCDACRHHAPLGAPVIDGGLLDALAADADSMQRAPEGDLHALLGVVRTAIAMRTVTLGGKAPADRAP